MCDAVHVGVGHDDDLAVAQLGGIEIVLADAGAERRDHGANFFVAQHLVVAGLLDVEDLALQRQDGLEAAVAALLGGAAGGFALDQEQLAALRIALRAIGQLAGQAAGIQRALAARQVAGFAGRFTRARGFDRLADDLASRRSGSSRRYSPSVSLTNCLHDAGDVGVELALGLPFELRLRQLHADHGDQTFAHVVAGQVFFYVLEQAQSAGRRS